MHAIFLPQVLFSQLHQELATAPWHLESIEGFVEFKVMGLGFGGWFFQTYFSNLKQKTCKMTFSFLLESCVGEYQKVGRSSLGLPTKVCLLLGIPQDESACAKVKTSNMHKGMQRSLIPILMQNGYLLEVQHSHHNFVGCSLTLGSVFTLSV